MQILEKDLFNYIFYPDVLNKNSYLYIYSNHNKFKPELELLENIKLLLKEKISSYPIDTILNKIERLKKKQKIALLKVEDSRNKFKQFTLAAASPDFERVLTTDTFKDADSEYLVKILTNQSQNKIIIFSKDNIELTNVKLTIEPSGQIFEISSTNYPLIIEPKQVIENISIEF